MKRCGVRFALVAAVVVLTGLASCVGAAQQTAAPGLATALEGDRSFYRGRPVTDPDGLSGLWEISNGKGGARGIHLILSTSVEPFAKSDPKTLVGVEQQWEHLEIGVYERQGPELVFGEEGFFSDSPRGGGSTLEDGHLQLHFVSRVAGDPGVDLDLRKEDGDRWVGRFHKGDFDEQVTLERPGAGLKTHNAIAGAWTSEGPANRVVHVAEQEPGQFVGWSDVLQIPGTIGFGPRVQPHRLLQMYGDRVKVQRAGERGVLFEFGAYSGICCPRTAAGILSADGKEIRVRDVTVPFTQWKKSE